MCHLGKIVHEEEARQHPVSSAFQSFSITHLLVRIVCSRGHECPVLVAQWICERKVAGRWQAASKVLACPLVRLTHIVQALSSVRVMRRQCLHHVRFAQQYGHMPSHAACTHVLDPRDARAQPVCCSPESMQARWPLGRPLGRATSGHAMADACQLRGWGHCSPIGPLHGGMAAEATMPT